jgi:2'-5' RNA ligase
MPFALELALDDRSAAAVRTLWRALAHDGFPFMADSGANPHVSLAIWDEIAHAPMTAAVAHFAGETAPLPVVFERVDVFPETGVVFLAPRTDPRLLAVQARCHQRLAAHGRQAWPHYHPQAWVPHCTLAHDVDGPRALAHARAVSERMLLPVVGRLERAELIEFHPVRCLLALPLAGPSSAS